MLSGDALRAKVQLLLGKVVSPAQYIGGELNAVVKDPSHLTARVCMAFPDAYTIGQSHHGLQVLYSIINSNPNWWCERVFAPWPDFEQALRERICPSIP